MAGWGDLSPVYAPSLPLITNSPRSLTGLIDQTRRLLAGVQWRTSAVAWVDYDLFRGPAGLVLAGASNTGPTDPFVPAARHLARLCDDPGLEGLRAGTEISPPSAFNIGRINTGMGHGVTGVASALRHAVETFEDGSDYRPALRRACDWLVEEAYLADRDFITWPPVGRDGARASGVADRRQAWCYGTPGVAWTLWDAGRVLGDPSLQVLGEEAMRSFCRVFDADFQLPHTRHRRRARDLPRGGRHARRRRCIRALRCVARGSGAPRPARPVPAGSRRPDSRYRENRHDDAQRSRGYSFSDVERAWRRAKLALPNRASLSFAEKHSPSPPRRSVEVWTASSEMMFQYFNRFMAQLM